MKLKSIHIVLTVCILTAMSCFSGRTFAQQYQPYTQYLFNRFLLNPAACGADGYTILGLTIKDQWTGFGDSPFNQTLTGQIRVPREGLLGRGVPWAGTGNYSPEKIGLGISLFNDVRGPIRTTGGNFTYAYHLEDGVGQLSFGLTASFYQLSVNRDKIRTLNEDPFLEGSKLNGFVPDASFGVHYTMRNFYVGVSTTNLFQSYLTFGGRVSSNFRMERQHLFIGGYIFDVSPEFSIVPAAQFRLYENGINQFDVNLMGYYFDLFWGGFSYRSGGGGTKGNAALIFGVRYNQYYFGYAFDYTLSDIQRYTYGSHEFMVNITIGRSERFYRYQRRYEFQDSEQQWRRMWTNRRGIVN